jgi:primosomal protein N' (replication factor Y)
VKAGIARVAVPAPLYRLFDYRPAPGGSVPPPGSRVLVPFGGRRLVGLVVETAAESSVDPERLRPVDKVLDAALLDRELLDLLAWSARYYAAPPGEIVAHGLPALLRRNRPVPAPQREWLTLSMSFDPDALARAPRQRDIAELLAGGPRTRADLLAAGARGDALRRMLDNGTVATCDPPALASSPGPELNPAQRSALAAILRARARFRALLLAGVTGSGKTEVYLQAARHVLRRGRQVLVLLPEIGLTPQFVRRVEQRLGRRAHVYHSGLSDGERCETWRAAAAGEADLLIGTRSAVFLPLPRPGLIVVDEEHDASFKQFDAMRYHARDVAVMRASRLGVPVVLGSATPSLESLHNAERGRYELLTLPRRAGAAALPHWRVEDPRGGRLEGGLTTGLVQAMAATLARGGQVLVYRNRRGFAPVLICNECGWHADCEHCSAHLTWHRAAGRLNCHHCGRSRPVPPRCPDCGAPRLEAVGAGTERIEQVLSQRFPDVPVLRADRDAVRGRDDFERLLARTRDGRPCVLVGTQMLAKGHHLPGIELAVMLDADAALFSADFRAPERLAQSIVQVAGRAGRGGAGAFVLVSRHGEHPLLQALAGGDYAGAAGLLLAERREAGLPPFAHLAMVRAEARDAERARDFLRAVAAGVDARSIDVAGPVAAILQRRAGYWRYQLWLMSPARAALARETARLPGLIEAMPEADALRWHIDVDPLDM